jgi:hypothetical protein
MIQAGSFQRMFHVHRKILLYPQIRLGGLLSKYQK